MENYQNYNKNDSWKDDMVKKQDEELESRSRKPYKESSPEEVKKSVKETVSKGVAAAAGAVEGFADEMEKDDVAETAGRAIEQVGQTTKKIAETTRKVAVDTKKAIKGETSSDPASLDRGDAISEFGGASDSSLDAAKGNVTDEEDEGVGSSF